MNKLFLILVFICFGISCSSQKSNSNKIQNILNEFATDSCFKAASIGIVIANTEDESELASLNRNMVLTPASSQKLITTATALEVLSNDFRFKTSIVTDGTIESGIVKGNLIVKGFGDPSLNSKYFKERQDVCKIIVQKLRKRKIRKIQGKIIVDTDYFQSSIPSTWIWEDIGNYYGAVPHSLSYKDNMYTLFFNSGKAGSPTKIDRIVPEKTGLKFENEVVSSTINRDLAYIFGGNTNTQRRIEGSIPQNRKSFAVKGAIQTPEISFLHDLNKELSASNIIVNNSEIKALKRRELFSIHSPKLEEIVYWTNQKSVNLFADHLLFEIAKQKNEKANWKNGVNAIKDFWNEHGIKSNYQSLYDGSGLSHFNAISASYFNQILLYMHSSANQEAFLSSLPIAGKSGTLKSFGKNTAIELNWKAKTGSMTGIRSYCGYLKNSKGEVYTVSILLNNYNCSNSKLNNKVLNLLIKVYNS